MKAQRLQAVFARRREADFERIEKTQAVDKYFDHWNKVTTRFEAWTDPEYYEHAEESLRKEREKKIKERKLEERRAKLKQLLDAEEAEYERELQELNKSKPRKLPNDLLEKLNQDQKYQNEEKRRLDLESKLYGRWRYGINDENILFESKSDNQALAKLNWLDKQIENRMQKEEESKQAEERHLKLLEETRKREENLKEQQKIREAEIKELRAMQASNLAEMKSREIQSIHLRKREAELRSSVSKMEKEMKGLSTRKSNKPKMEVPHNIKRIKMFIRQQSEQVRSDLKEDINILNRVLKDHPVEDVELLRNTYEAFYEREITKQSTIEAMYESEAKHDLIKCQEEWARLFEDREAQISWVLIKTKKKLEAELNQNLEEQKRLLEVRQMLLTSTENSNEKLKAIKKEQESYVQANDLMDSCSREIDQKNTNTANSSDNDNSPRRPQFGRKKVAWT